ncbi:TlpA family protein disulfide reductase [Anaeromyxobacter oryzisoli]|jgi:thiol-disulfide isomerase/thioredoxin|uniref:TlpA family protein disulfide reductase n=1 Tax=Anaeromyxobacter oryzisoli TaxID=2925408 RepID=UPI001F5A3C03|nr:TlpA disulfide reductase family protein [Anaeromyxobacter sp. SG63]
MTASLRRAALAAALVLAAACKRDDKPVQAAPLPAPAPSADVRSIDIFRTASAAAPAIDLPTIDGKRFSLAAVKGQVVFVNFWATWCPPCRDEMPSMLALGRELEGRYPGKFKMVAISADDGWTPVKEFFGAPPYLGSTQGITVALDASSEKTTVAAYFCTARGACPKIMFPESYLVKDGRIVGFFEGPLEWSNPAARAYLEQLIRS